MNMAWNLGNKLTKAHMQWEKRKMNVQIAAETISNSVADAMKFLKDDCEDFKDVGGTSEYIRTFNDIFDTMNSFNFFIPKTNWFNFVQHELVQFFHPEMVHLLSAFTTTWPISWDCSMITC